MSDFSADGPDGSLGCHWLGLGCRRGAAPAAVIALAERALLAARIGRPALAGIASIDGRGDEPALQAAARHFGVPLLLFDAATLERQTPRLLTPSAVVFAATGCHGVAEGAALAAAGADGRLVVAKMVSGAATAAVAMRAEAKTGGL